MGRAMNHEEYIIEKRLELVSLAKGMVSGEIHLIEGIRKICSLRFEVEDPGNNRANTCTNHEVKGCYR
jgi:hypothetical protein